MLYKFGKKVSPLCSFCMLKPESPAFSFLHKNKLSPDAATTFFPKCIIPPITPQSAIFGFTDHKVNYHMISHILLIFKYYL